MAEAEKDYKFPFKVNDRVQRSSKGAKKEGCLGTVVAVQEETSPAGGQTNSNSLLITVLWDNGSQSSMGVEGLSAA